MKSELRKRKLAVSGLKAVLADRLKINLQESGYDVDTFNFNTNPDQPTPEKPKKLMDLHKLPKTANSLWASSKLSNNPKIDASLIRKYPFNNETRSILTNLSDFSNLPETQQLRREHHKVHLPSVTKIIKETMSEESKRNLKAWEDRMIAQMGIDNFNKMVKQTLEAGSMLHSCIEKFFMEGVLPAAKSMEKLISRNHLTSVNSIIETFHKPPLALESQVIHPDLNYVGYMDAVTIHVPRELLTLRHINAFSTLLKPII